MPIKKDHFDVAVIGGGAAGMMAAGRAAELGARVVLLEKNATLGKKLLITGGGRCNVTNAELDVRRFLSKFKDNKKFLFSPFSKYGVSETLDFFHDHKMPTKVELENRAFPVSNSAQSVWNVLVAYMQKGKVIVQADSPIIGFEYDEHKITGVKLKNKKIITAKSYILATGGKSRPETGSSGDGFEWLKEIGHTVIEPTAALVPINIKETYIHKLAGVSLQDVKLTSFLNNKKQASDKGKMLFTHFGLSGPLVLNMSRDISELLKYGPVTLALDLRPGVDMSDLDKELQAKLKESQNKQIRNSLSGFILTSLITALLKLAEINPDKATNIVTREERLRLVKLMKALPMTVTSLRGVDKAIVTSGGVKLEEVDFKSMQSKKYTNLYLVGDILNIDRPSGGYSLQLCWTTGFVAGTAAAEK